MKVLFILADDRLGGPQKRLMSLNKYFQDLGIETFLATPKVNCLLSSECRKFGQTHMILPIWKASRGLSSVHSLVVLPLSIIKLYLELRSLDVDLVVAHGSMSIQVLLAAKVARKKTLWFVNDTIFSKTVSHCIARLYSFLSDKIVIQGEFLRMHYGFRSDVVSILSPAFPSKKLSSKRDRGRVFTYGLLANINPIKDIDLFIDSAAILASQDKNLRFIVQGDMLKTQRKYYLNLVNKVHRLNLERCFKFQPFNSNIEPFYDAIDVLIITSKSEASPNVLCDAMVRGIPTISTDVGAVSEMLGSSTDEPAGVLLETRLPVELAKKALHVSIHSDEYERYASNAITRSKNALSAEAFPRFIKEAIEEV